MSPEPKKTNCSGYQNLAYNIQLMIWHLDYVFEQQQGQYSQQHSHQQNGTEHTWFCIWAFETVALSNNHQGLDHWGAETLEYMMMQKMGQALMAFFIRRRWAKYDVPGCEISIF